MLVSTLVPGAALMGNLKSGDAPCATAPSAAARTADTYLLTPGLDTPARRLGN